MPEGIRDPRSPLWSWIRTALTLLLVPIVIWAFNVNTRLAVIESNRFTSNDGHKVWRAIDSKADKVDVPPARVIHAIEELESVKDRVTRIEAHYGEIIRRLEIIEQVARNGGG